MSLSEHHTSNTTDFWFYVISRRTSLLPKAPEACPHRNLLQFLYTFLCTVATKEFLLWMSRMIVSFSVYAIALCNCYMFSVAVSCDNNYTNHYMFLVTPKLHIRRRIISEALHVYRHARARASFCRKFHAWLKLQVGAAFALSLLSTSHTICTGNNFSPCQSLRDRYRDL